MQSGLSSPPMNFAGHSPSPGRLGVGVGLLSRDPMAELHDSDLKCIQMLQPAHSDFVCFPSRQGEAAGTSPVAQYQSNRRPPQNEYMINAMGAQTAASAQAGGPSPTAVIGQGSTGQTAPGFGYGLSVFTSGFFGLGPPTLHPLESIASSSSSVGPPTGLNACPPGQLFGGPFGRASVGSGAGSTPSAPDSPYSGDLFSGFPLPGLPLGLSRMPSIDPLAAIPLPPQRLLSSISISSAAVGSSDERFLRLTSEDEKVLSCSMEFSLTDTLDGHRPFATGTSLAPQSSSPFEFASVPPAGQQQPEQQEAPQPDLFTIPMQLSGFGYGAPASMPLPPGHAHLQLLQQQQDLNGNRGLVTLASASPSSYLPGLPPLHPFNQQSAQFLHAQCLQATEPAHLAGPAPFQLQANLTGHMAPPAHSLGQSPTLPGQLHANSIAPRSVAALPPFSSFMSMHGPSAQFAGPSPVSLSHVSLSPAQPLPPAFSLRSPVQPQVVGTGAARMAAMTPSFSCAPGPIVTPIVRAVPSASAHPQQPSFQSGPYLPARVGPHIPAQLGLDISAPQVALLPHSSMGPGASFGMNQCGAGVRSGSGTGIVTEPVTPAPGPQLPPPLPFAAPASTAPLHQLPCPPLPSLPQLHELPQYAHFITQATPSFPPPQFPRATCTSASILPTPPPIVGADASFTFSTQQEPAIAYAYAPQPQVKRPHARTPPFVEDGAPRAKSLKLSASEQPPTPVSAAPQPQRSALSTSSSAGDGGVGTKSTVPAAAATGKRGALKAATNANGCAGGNRRSAPVASAPDVSAVPKEEEKEKAKASAEAVQQQCASAGEATATQVTDGSSAVVGGSDAVRQGLRSRVLDRLLAQGKSAVVPPDPPRQPESVRRVASRPGPVLSYCTHSLDRHPHSLHVRVLLRRCTDLKSPGPPAPAAQRTGERQPIRH